MTPDVQSLLLALLRPVSGSMDSAKTARPKTTTGLAIGDRWDLCWGTSLKPTNNKESRWHRGEEWVYVSGSGAGGGAPCSKADTGTFTGEDRSMRVLQTLSRVVSEPAVCRGIEARLVTCYRIISAMSAKWRTVSF